MNVKSPQSHRILDVEPTHVVITGATSGLGWALAELYASPGRTLSLMGRDRMRIGEIKKICETKGAQVYCNMVDVTDPEAMEQWLIGQDEKLPIDLMIANAGMGGAAVVPSKYGEDGPVAREILAVNTMGVINSVTPVLPRMIKRGAGQLALVGSISAAIGLPQSPVYCASKAAVKTYGDALRRLVRPHGVKVTNVLPGFIDTPMSQSLEMTRLWCWSAEDAAKRIARDVSRGAAQSVFPWQLRLSLGMQNFLPVQIMDFILATSMRFGWDKKTAPESELD
jgi:short-subunit dehydrogenase